MKRIWLIIVTILCLSSLIGGRLYWNHKVNEVKKASQQGQIDASNIDETGSGQSFSDRIKKLPKALRSAAQNANRENGQVRVALLGTSNEEQLAPLLQQRLDQTFGEAFFKVTAKNLGKTTSLALNRAKIADLVQSADGKPDLVIFTPLVYNDDRQVSTADTRTAALILEKKVNDAYPKASFLVNLPNYSSNKAYMNDRIDELSAFIRKQDLPLLDYLSDWPDGAKRADVVKEDGETMNASGQKIWIDYVSKQWGLNKS
ncbi:hypothetical protein M3N64_12140 [Sporolactobacillus sp. CPB3-1]|uniref:SGNH hydrolase-type esterase domain-containing protein n=1 Tax=Sporolactobacillus mangiferae TaxID=2940498 RepID=A0ABT0MCR5_9BACL|nr:hypothetical protein [Sporolactobacillus mangiferae]MCL1632669.1 hypothetical protein [Sporolactobacillus mangiferae]